MSRGVVASKSSLVLIYACCSGIIVKRAFTLTRVLGWTVNYVVILGPSQAQQNSDIKCSGHQDV